VEPFQEFFFNTLLGVQPTKLDGTEVSAELLGPYAVGVIWFLRVTPIVIVASGQLFQRPELDNLGRLVSTLCLFHVLSHLQLE
jgi:hypothetical protein